MINNNPFLSHLGSNALMNRLSAPMLGYAQGPTFFQAQQKNIDAMFKANRHLSDGYARIATKQAHWFEDNLKQITRFSPENATVLSQKAIQEGLVRAQEIQAIALESHKNAYNILSQRAKDIVDEMRH